MNKKRGILALLSIALICVVAIGYAAVTGSAVITGTTGAVAGELDLIFTADGASVGAKSANVTATATAHDTASAEFTANGFKAVGDSVVLTFTLKNASTDYQATGLSVAVSGGNLTKWTVDADLGATTLNPDATTTVTITVELIEAVDDVTTATWTVTVSGNGVPFTA